MKIPVFTLIMAGLLCYGTISRAQNQILNDNQGKPVMEQSYIDVEGSPYLTATWLPGIVSLANGKTVAAKLKYDLVKDELLFQSPRDSMALAFVTPVKSFRFDIVGTIDESSLAPLIFSNGYPAIDEQTEASFYQVVADGKAKLLKRYKKVIHSNQAFNSATTTKTFALRDAVYYLLADNKIIRVKPTPKTIAAALADKTDQVQTFIKTNKIDFKSDRDLAKLFTYYNSL
ncbi:hypothetical protein [Mucilaginibacter ginsenosidivorax]|uniref:DUF4369 domain-containing protein n=1 Tax=Mucilaginibacter ginsenosidivorax TaxID=862126 RepID=A0A5B8W070_9SPHI|nr:hypothetical protein [Mucilaginibacter ginsenosidivorax]QEC77031.1 hypothetical protein FSB76_14160 [Mucilaginibacter ginsenosidivorax]